MPAAASLLRDQYLAQQLGLIGFENSTVFSVQRALERAERQLLGEIAAAYSEGLASGTAVPWTGIGYRYKIRALTRVQEAMKEMAIESRDLVHKALTELSREQASLLQSALSEMLPDSVLDQLKLSKVNLRQLAALVDDKMGENATGSVAKILHDFDELGAKAIPRVQRALESAISDGASLSKTTTAVVESLKVARHEAAAYVRTVIMQTANDSARLMHQENADILQGEQYVATLDDSTCPICGPLDGNVYYFDKGPNAPRPPLHPGCRCYMSPYLKSWRELGLPESIPDVVKQQLNGRRAERITWEQWVTAKNSRLESALGPTRAELFRQGKAKLDDFATRTEIIPLRDLAAARKKTA